MERLVLTLNTGGSPYAGTRNYEKLDNKPMINGVPLSGDQTSSDLRIVSVSTSSEWDDTPAYTPSLGEICVYSDTSWIKIGDGETPIAALPFVYMELNTMRDDGDGLFVSSIAI